MKILIIHQYFNVPEIGGPLRSYYLAEGLKRNGYQVEIITAHNHSKAISKEIEGIMVHYLPVYYSNSLGFWSRIKAFLNFARLALRKAKSINDLDLCYAISTPLTVGWVALKLKSLKNLPYIFEVGDLWPEAPIQVKALRNPLLIHLLKNFERKVYQQAQKIVALSPGIRDGILKSAPNSKPVVVPNMSDCDYFQMHNKSLPQLERLGLQDKFVIIYFGAIGKANHLEYLVDAAKSTEQAKPQIHFIVAGCGSELKRIKRRAKHQKNITFLDYLSKSALNEVLSICDAVYVSYADVPILSTGSPNKFFDGLASGKLMILNFHGWLQEIAEEKELGFYTNPKDPEELATQLEPFIEDPTLLLKYQKSAREAAELYFSKEIALQKILKIIDNEHQMKVKGSEVYTLTA